MMVKFITPAQYAALHGISERRIQILCKQGRIPGVQLIGSRYIIPTEAEYIRKTPGRKKP